ncbi:MAG TPA: hypothetical protein VHX17_05685 [Candidatus Cybelea sp.]|jgi:hypothetical protein|nr:hypothetical protein [Candidatus Cybelea sp.]
MPDVRLERSLRVPADLALQVLGDVLMAIANQEGPWRGFALHVALGDLRLPDVGYVAVPIELTASKHHERDAVDITFRAARLPAAFPTFKGAMGVTPGELGECSLYLTGAYDIPMRIFGNLLDAAIAPGVAARSLENFVEEIATACQARVDRREAEFARYRYYSTTLR